MAGSCEYSSQSPGCGAMELLLLLLVQFLSFSSSGTEMSNISYHGHPLIVVLEHNHFHSSTVECNMALRIYKSKVNKLYPCQLYTYSDMPNS